MADSANLECKVHPNCALVVRAVGTVHVAVDDRRLPHARIADDKHLMSFNVSLS
jgi:hypothetical protein